MKNSNVIQTIKLDQALDYKIIDNDNSRISTTKTRFQKNITYNN